ncbi:LacI family DNA-binding transcriptional regulator [Enterovibrio baiacu]|uniref:LacI family DNA-binding transcriptional regulator n=1 Tax=Enterovibrio baiacu TaxID=2491023 RepID=UPI003D0A133C
MTRKVTIKQIADKAGVSVATVDRVINKRAPVKSDTIELVLSAAAELGWRASTPINLSHNILTEQERVNCGFLIQRNVSPFLVEELKRLTKTSLSLSATFSIEIIEDLDPKNVANKIREFSQRVDALAITAIDHPYVSEAIDNVSENNVPVVALLSDITSPNLAGYIGTDNRKRGRTSAWAMHHFCGKEGKIGVLIGSHRYVSQEDREISFRSYFREKAPSFTVLESIVCLDDADLAYRATLRLLKEHADLVGVFSAGGGSAGIIRAFAEHCGDKTSTQSETYQNKPFYVSPELTPETRNGLIGGAIDMVISADFAQIAQTAAKMLISRKRDPRYTPKQFVILPFSVYTSENI